MKNITYSNELSVEDYCILRKSVGWADVSPTIVSQALNKSDYIISASVGSVKVGMARVMSDGTQALVMDVIVHPDYQGNGIGNFMMNGIMEYLHNSLHDGQHLLVNLNSTKGRESFYIQYGFEIRPSENFGTGMAQWVSENELHNQKSKKHPPRDF